MRDNGCVVVDNCRESDFLWALVGYIAEYLFDMCCEFIYNQISPNRMMDSFTKVL